MLEGFAEGGGGNYYAESDWQLEMNRALTLITANKIILAQTYPTLTRPERAHVRARHYLLVKGSRTYVNSGHQRS